MISASNLWFLALWAGIAMLVTRGALHVRARAHRRKQQPPRLPSHLRQPEPGRYRPTIETTWLLGALGSLSYAFFGGHRTPLLVTALVIVGCAAMGVRFLHALFRRRRTAGAAFLSSYLLLMLSYRGLQERFGSYQPEAHVSLQAWLNAFVVTAAILLLVFSLEWRPPVLVVRGGRHVAVAGKALGMLQEAVQRDDPPQPPRDQRALPVPPPRGLVTSADDPAATLPQQLFPGTHRPSIPPEGF